MISITILRLLLHQIIQSRRQTLTTTAPYLLVSKHPVMTLIPLCPLHACVLAISLFILGFDLINHFLSFFNLLFQVLHAHRWSLL